MVYSIINVYIVIVIVLIIININSNSNTTKHGGSSFQRLLVLRSTSDGPSRHCLCIYIYIYTHIYIYIYACMYVCIYIYICIWVTRCCRRPPPPRHWSLSSGKGAPPSSDTPSSATGIFLFENFPIESLYEAWLGRWSLEVRAIVSQ